MIEGERLLQLDHISTIQKSSLPCPYGAPLIAIAHDGKFEICQACCNHWDCPVCRYKLYAYHRHRMIEGAKILMATGDLYFWTITCRGKELDLATSDDNYYTWTNRLLARARYHAHKAGSRWAYCQVTERQRRGAAHSHFLHTFMFTDAIPTRDSNGNKKLVSRMFTKANVQSGLGGQCDVSKVESADKVASYIAKYLSKAINLNLFPAGWKRIRYSRSWGDYALVPDIAITLHNREAYNRADKYPVMWRAQNETIYGIARHRMAKILPPL